ncbi:hypothetical protein TIFTF001_023764 [Ficus carica]|uniref:Uncharacterized protein n=1 Tax=Ficus carica TaxID=3494 RepID=A0AA88AL16_FICCA|nr:hypothetical protein TIFTF001_023764 [Ficus carica]
MKSSRCGQVHASFTHIIEETRISSNLTHHKIGRSSNIKLAMCRNKILPNWNFSYNVSALVLISRCILELETSNIPVIIDREGHVQDHIPDEHHRERINVFWAMRIDYDFRIFEF